MLVIHEIDVRNQVSERDRGENGGSAVGNCWPSAFAFFHFSWIMEV